MDATTIAQVYGGPNLGPPPGTSSFTGARGEAAWLVPPGIELIRGLRTTCDRAQTPLLPGREDDPLYLTWRLRTARLYANDCVHEFTTKRPLQMLNLMHADTLQALQRLFTNFDYSAYPVIEKYFKTHPSVRRDVPLTTRLNTFIGSGIGVNRPIDARMYPGSQPAPGGGIIWQGIPYGPGQNSRNSIMYEDDIVVLAVATVLPEYDGILSLQAPNSKGEMFHEEMIVFPQVSDKLTPVSLEPFASLERKFNTIPALRTRLGAKRRKTRRTKTRRRTRANPAPKQTPVHPSEGAMRE
jgi:hypothetical protein